jgi:hypothetical protein
MHSLNRCQSLSKTLGTQSEILFSISSPNHGQLLPVPPFTILDLLGFLFFLKHSRALGLSHWLSCLTKGSLDHISLCIDYSCKTCSVSSSQCSLSLPLLWASLILLTLLYFPHSTYHLPVYTAINFIILIGVCLPHQKGNLHKGQTLVCFIHFYCPTPHV